MYCPKCGSEIDEAQNFCSDCGHPLQSGEEEKPQGKVPGEPPRKKKSSGAWFYIIFFVCLALAIWGFYSSSFSGTGLKDIVQKQLTEIKNNQITKAYYEHFSTDYKKTISLEQFKKFIQENPALANFRNLEIVDSTQENNFGVVNGMLRLLDNVAVPIKYEFVKEDGEWRVLKISLESPVKVSDASDSSPEKAAVIAAIKEYLETIKRGDTKTAYYDLSSPEFQKPTSYKDFQEFFPQFPAFSDYKDIDFPLSDFSSSHAAVTAVLYSESGALPLEFTLNKENGAWKVWSLHVLQMAEGDGLEPLKNPQELYQPITAFTEALRDGKLEQAYEGTSKKFQATTSLDDFKAFVKRFPIVAQSTPQFVENTHIKNLAQVRAKLSDDDEELLVDYTLAKEDDAWKILGLQIVDQGKAIKEDGTTDGFDTSDMTNAIKSQLDDLKGKDLFKAYQDYTSKEFKEATSFDTFASFVEQNPVFSKNASSDFGRLSLDNNVATLKGVLTSDSGETAQVEYDLIKEGDDWKVLGIKILSKQKADPPPEEASKK